MTRLLLVVVTMGIIHAIMTWAYAVRIAGVRTGRLAISLSLYNIIFLAASTANAIQVPVLAKILDETISASNGNFQLYLDIWAFGLRLTLVGAAVGTLGAAILMPSFINVFVRAIIYFEEAGSMPKLLRAVLRPRSLQSLPEFIRFPRWTSVCGVLSWQRLKDLAIPRSFLLANIFITAFHAVGLQAAMYAGGLLPELRTTASGLTSVIYGGATLGLVLLVDPVAARITDQALRGERAEEDVQQMVCYLVLTRLVGVVLSQAFLWPGALAVVWIAQRI